MGIYSGSRNTIGHKGRRSKEVQTTINRMFPENLYKTTCSSAFCFDSSGGHVFAEEKTCENYFFFSSENQVILLTLHQY